MTPSVALPIRTDRLVLRMMRSSDAATHTEYRNDASLARFQGWDLPYPLADAEAKLRTQDGLEDLVVGGWTTLAIELDTEVVGDVAVRLEPGGGVAEIGFTLVRSFQGRGYAAEAVSAVVEHLVESLGVVRVFAELDPGHVASQRVLEAAGLVFESTAKRSVLWRGEWSDSTTYATTAQEYRAWVSRRTEPAEDVRLVAITASTARGWAELATHHSQRRFVAPVAQSFTDALFPEIQNGAPVVPWLRGIEADGEQAGFVMITEVTDHHPEPYLWRLLLDRRFQGRGIGRAALELLAGRLREQGCPSLAVSWVDARGGPAAFYERHGFVRTGVVEHGEALARLRL